MKKKFFTLFFALAASVGTIFAEKVQIGDLYYKLNLTDKTAEVTSQNSSYPYWSKTITTANIPASVTYSGTTYSVTSIGGDAFRGCSGLTSVTIPNSVTSIGHSAFEDCSSLTSITIPNSVTSIGYGAFQYCSSLTSVTIGNSVTSIGNYAFCSCSSLTSIEIPNSVTSIGDKAFYNCSGLTSVTIPNSVTSIGEGAFANCSSLTSVAIPNSVTSLGMYAFHQCSSLTSVTIPNSVTSIGEAVFQDCSSLTSVTIGNSVTSIGESAFDGCSKLTSVTIPNRVTSIGYRAFYNCSSLPVVDNLRYADTYLVEAVDKTLSSYTIRNGTKWIGDYAFYDCDGLTSVTIPNSVTSIGDGAFAGCSSLTSVTIPNSVTSIGEYAFRDCSSLTSVTIGNSVTSIGDYAFYNCSGLPVVDNLRYADTYLVEAVDKTLSSYTIRNGTKWIGDDAFWGCRSLTSVTIPNSVTSIGGSAFSGCSSLTSVTIPNGVTSIGGGAFYGCSSLTSVTIPNSVTSIGNYAFENCSGLTSVTIGEGVTSIGWSAFSGCSSLTAIYVPCGEMERFKQMFWEYRDKVKYTPLPYTITINAINGNVTYPQTMCDDMLLNATPDYGYHFVKWSDGVTDNPRTIELKQDTTFTAEFAKDPYLVKIEDLYYNLNEPDKTAEVCGLTGKIRIDDNSMDDWNMQPAQYVAQTTCPADAAYIGLKSVKVYADTKYINILVEPNMDDLSDLSYVQFHIFLNTDNSDATGGYGDMFTDANSDILLEGALFYDNNPCTYAPFVFKWWGGVGESGWTWTDPSVHNTEDCWGAIVCEGQLQGCNSQYVNGKFEIQIDRSFIPATWNNTAFGIGFDIEQNWSSVGILPCMSPTDNNPNGKAAKLQVTIDNTPYAEISGDIVIPEMVNYDGVTYSVTSIGDNAFYGRTDLNSVTIETETPLTLGSNAFYNTNNCPIYVPCNTASAYKSAWPDYANRIKYAPLPYKISTQAENGSVTTTDVTTLTICDEPFITCTATPDYGYHFTQWSDGLKDNPRIFRLTQDTTFTAEFAYDRVGTCGKDLALIWSYDPTNKVLTIGNAGEFTENMQFGSEAPTEMEELVIGNNVTAIGENAFAGISTLKKVTIGESVKTIHNNAFYNCVNLETIFNYRPTPTNAYSTAFDGVDKFECILYVLPNSIDMYKNASVWRDFYYTYAIGAEEATVTTNDVKVEPQDNAATLTWPTSNNAVSYTIEITKDGVVFCRLTFNANGQLTGIAFAPGRDGQSMAPAAVMTANGLQFTVTGLDSNTQYGYSLTAKDANEQPIATYSGSFTTTSEGVPTGIDNTPFLSGEGSGEASKILRNGEVLILRDGKTYSIQGVEVR